MYHGTRKKKKPFSGGDRQPGTDVTMHWHLPSTTNHVWPAGWKNGKLTAACWYLLLLSGLLRCTHSIYINKSTTSAKYQLQVSCCVDWESEQRIVYCQDICACRSYYMIQPIPTTFHICLWCWGLISFFFFLQTKNIFRNKPKCCGIWFTPVKWKKSTFL